MAFEFKHPSNHKKTYTKCGKWALPVFPTNLSLVGSPKTPYIYDDRCNSEDAALQIKALYNMGDKKRKEIGKLGLKWALSEEAGFTSEKMSNRVIEGMDELFNQTQTIQFILEIYVFILVRNKEFNLKY